MSADWRNEQAILRDLAIAQGIVPVESVETVSCNEKPPSVHIEEETEEPFIRQYAADGTSVVTPDFGLIQDMLDLVRNVRVNDIENSDENSESASRAGITDRKSPQKPATVPSIKKNKSAAQQSTLSQQETIERGKNQPLLVLQPESMFRPRSKTSVNASISKESGVSNVSNESEVKVSKPGVFVPSSQAQEYYNRLMETKRQRELREETIWTRAERQMREIEEKRRNKVAN